MKHIEYAVVAEQREIASGIYSLWLETERIAQEANPGQFLSLYRGDDSRMLPRPISVCETDRERGRLRLVYRVAGKGTEEFSRLQKGEKLEILGPLGNGFPLKKKKAFLIGGGIGIPPMVQLAKELKTQAEIQIIAGYRDELFLTKS